MPGKAFNIDLVLGAVLTSNFTKTLSGAESKIISLQNTVKKLRSEFKDIFANPDLSGLEKLKLGGLNKIQQGLTRMQMGSTRLSSAGSNAMGLYYQTRMYGRVFENSAKAAMSYETALAGVKKVVKFDNAQQFTDMSNAILSMTHTIPMTAEGIARIVASGGQAGIAREELLGFAESAAKMGVAFNVTAEEAGDMMAAWRTAFKMGQSDVNTLADKINYLGNTTAALPTQIADVVTRIGPLGKVGGIASGEIAALGASAVAAGIQSEVAATGIKNLILTMTAGTGATKGQKAAFEDLGLSAAKVAQNMQVDARGTILDLFERISKMDVTRQAAALNEFFGKRGVVALAPLLSNLDALKANFDKVANAENYASGVNDAFARRTATTQNSIQLMDNSLKSVSVTAGQSLLPALNDVVRKVAEMGSGFQKFAAENPETTKALIKGSMGLFGIVAGAKLATISWQALSGAWTMASGAITALGGAMMAHPVLAAVTAIVGAGWYMYNNWDEIKTKWNVLMDGLEARGEKFRQSMENIARTAPGTDKASDAVNMMFNTYSVPGYATGGRFTRPTLSLIGEGDSPEYVIPTQGKYKSNGLALWAAAGRDLGVPMFAGGGAVNADNSVAWRDTPIKDLPWTNVFNFTRNWGAMTVSIYGVITFFSDVMSAWGKVNINTVAYKKITQIIAVLGGLISVLTLSDARDAKEYTTAKNLTLPNVDASQQGSKAQPIINNNFSVNVTAKGDASSDDIKQALEAVLPSILEKIAEQQRRIAFGTAMV